MSRPNHVRNSDISCLISILKSFSESHTTEDDEGFEHPLSFYDDEATTNSGKTTDERPSRCAKKRWMWISALLLLLLVVLVSALASTKSSRANRSSASSMSYECPGGRRKRRLGTTVDSSKSNSNLPAWTLETVRRLDTEENDFVNIGCFRVEKSPDNRTVTAPTLMERAAACDAACSTNYFGLAWDTDDNKDRNKDKDKDDDTDTCYCYVDKPKERLSIGPCHRIDVVYDLCDDENDSRSSPSHRMEVFFDPHWNEVCSQETTSTVRNFLVEEDDVPFGFDIVTSEFRPSPFELYKDECGTNMYEVQTEVSSIVFLFRRAVLLYFTTKPLLNSFYLIYASGFARKSQVNDYGCDCRGRRSSATRRPGRIYLWEPWNWRGRTLLFGVNCHCWIGGSSAD